MRNFLKFVFINVVLIFGIIESSYSQDFIIVENIEGEVKFFIDNKNTDIKLYTPYYLVNGGDIILKDKLSSVYLSIVKDGKRHYMYLTSSDNKSRYPLIDLITQNQTVDEKNQQSWLNKFLSMFLISYDEGYKLNDMLISQKNSVTRSFNCNPSNQSGLFSVKV